MCRLSSVFADGKLGGEPSLNRWTVNTATGNVTDDVLTTDNPGDLPGRDPRRVGREYRHGYLTGTREHPDTVEFGALIQHDFATAAATSGSRGPPVTRPSHCSCRATRTTSPTMPAGC